MHKLLPEAPILPDNPEAERTTRRIGTTASHRHRSRARSGCARTCTRACTRIWPSSPGRRHAGRIGKALT